MERGFKLQRRTRMLDGQWSDWRLEAECRHASDVLALWDRRCARTQESDDTGAQVQAEHRIISIATGETIKKVTIGV